MSTQYCEASTIAWDKVKDTAMAPIDTFEDLKALKINLAEIRQEIERLLGALPPERRSN